MARLNSPPEKYGTFDGICVYHDSLHDADFMRTASSLTGERVKEDPAFKKTMELAARMVTASRLAAAVYAMMPPYRRKHRYYRKLTGLAMKHLKEDKTEGEVVVELMMAIQLPKRKPRRKAAKRIILWVNPGRSEIILAPLTKRTAHQSYTSIRKLHLFHGGGLDKVHRFYG